MLRCCVYAVTVMDPPQMASVSCSRAFKEDTWKHTLLLSFQCLGVTCGQLSTAPLYLFASIDAENIDSEDKVYEHFSLIFWTFTLICLVKYAFIVLNADDDGEGGIFALYSLLCRHAKVGLLPSKNESEVMSYSSESPPKMKVSSRARRAIEKLRCFHYIMLVFALLGCCMTISDGVLTPAISAMSASTGVQQSLYELSKLFSASPGTHCTITNIIEKYVGVPTACVILVCLFMLQHFGTHKIGIIFAPIIAVWLLLVSGLGIYNISLYNPGIMCAVYPKYLYRFLRKANFHQWGSLGSVILCSAGADAMFSNLGHFSKKSIKLTFFCLVYPLLILCYAGQSAFISKNNHINYFNHLPQSVPKGAPRHMFVVFALFASAIGSQAAITASFSIIKQCLALGCFPRVKVIHTSDKIHGQIYIPDVNWFLMVFSLTVTISFHNIIKLGSATGLAISSGMVVTTCLATVVIATYWEKNLSQAACFLIFFGFLETMYLTGALLNLHRGAWFLFVLLAPSFTVMIAWHYGTKKKYEYDLENKVSTEWLTELSPGLGVARVAGIGFIHTDVVSGIPAFFSHFITNCPAFHQVLVLVSFKTLPVPYLPSSQQYLVGRIGPKDHRIYRCIVRYGYRDHVSTNVFEEQIISSIREFISVEENEHEPATPNEARRMVVIGTPSQQGRAQVSPNHKADTVDVVSFSDDEHSMEEGGFTLARRKKSVHFVLPPESRTLAVHAREELEGLAEAMESGTAYFLGKTHFKVRGDNSNIMKKLLIMAYVFLETNCRETSVALNIPRAAVLEVGMLYPI